MTSHVSLPDPALVSRFTVTAPSDHGLIAVFAFILCSLTGLPFCVAVPSYSLFVIKDSWRSAPLVWSVVMRH